MEFGWGLAFGQRRIDPGGEKKRDEGLDMGGKVEGQPPTFGAETRV